MSNLAVAPLKERLWHEMRAGLADYVPAVAGTDRLMCCCCGRFLPQDAFSLEHLIPRQVVKLDPKAVREDPATPVNVRSGNLLLCQAPLRHKGGLLHRLGCNSWKGRFYDGALRQLLTEPASKMLRPSNQFIIAALSLGYLAMVARFGYRVVLMRSGRVMREQFFAPSNFHPGLPLLSQLLLCGTMGDVPADASVWANPFSFTFEQDRCLVGVRSFVMNLPLSADPRRPIARHIRFAPSKYKLRPDFTTFFA